MSDYVGRWWHRDATSAKIVCDLCPRACALADGQRGLCFVRANHGDELVLTTYGRSSGFCVDPIEKKPLNHFYPGSAVLSFGTAGCNLTCKFCQNWDISKSRQMDRLGEAADGPAIARAAVAAGAASVAFTYNDPVIFAEYAIDVAAACRAVGVHPVAVTAGYICAEPRAEFFAAMDATNVDLKAFTEEFYRTITTSHLEAVKETLRYLVHETNVWTEITTLIIPGYNDSEREIGELCEFVGSELSPTVPLHFSAFHPDYKMPDVPATPPATLTRARQQALALGLKHVYTGNVHDIEGDTTSCASCGALLIERDWYTMRKYRLTKDGACPDCGARLAGHFADAAGTFGARRLPIKI